MVFTEVMQRNFRKAGVMEPVYIEDTYIRMHAFDRAYVYITTHGLVYFPSS